MKSNVEIIRETIEQVVNQKKIEKWNDYFSRNYIARGAPFIGIGYSVSSSAKKPIINKIFPGSPSEGKLKKGDELLWAEDEHQRWTTEKEISQGVSQGYQGSKYKYCVQRGSETLEFELTKGIFHPFDTDNKHAESDMQRFMTKEFPDLSATIQLIFSEGDKVVSLLEYHGTHTKYKREVIWREAWIARLSEGKIVESWPVIDESSYLRQLGYQLVPPGN